MNHDEATRAPRAARAPSGMIAALDPRMRKVRDIMEPNVFWLASDSPLERAAEMLTDRQISGAPVCDASGKIVGMFTKTDLAEHYGRVHEGRLVRDVMTPAVVEVRPDDTVERAVQLMAFAEIHRLLVLDGDRLEGIITSMDVLRDLAGFPRREHRVMGVAAPPRTAGEPTPEP